MTKKPAPEQEAPLIDALMDAISRYWVLAYAEGKEGRDHDTETGDAAECLHEIQTLIASLAVSPRPLTEPKRGTIHPAKALFLRTYVGKASNENGEYEMAFNTGVTPMVTSKKTGKTWHLQWQDLIEMAVEAGVDDE